MGRLTRIESTINSTISTYAHQKVMPRGLPNFVDPLLRGSIRFGKRTGNSIAVINPDNTFPFGAVPNLKDSEVQLSRSSQWMSIDSIIELGGKERHHVEDVSEATLSIKGEIKTEFSTLDRVVLYGSPLRMTIQASAGSTTVLVKSPYKLANGDVFAFQQAAGLLESIAEIRASQTIFLGTSGDSEYPLVYNLTLDKPLPVNLKNDELVWIRAYPAYFSSSVQVPNAFLTSEPLGPFLIDHLSGNLLEGQTFRETLAIKTINRSGNFVEGDDTRFSTTYKNRVILDRPWSSHYPMFWVLDRGALRITPDRVVFKVDEDLEFVCGLKCVPPLPTDTERSWRVSVRSNEDCTIRFVFAPHPPQEFTLTSGVNQTITLTIPDDPQPVTNIEINVLAASDICEVQVADWTPIGNTIETLEYSLVTEVAGEANYQSTGLIIKPYFLGSEFLKTNWDSGATYDGGKVWF